MLTRKIHIHVALFVLCLHSTLLPAADFNKGLDYMESGNFAKAYCLWEPLAQLGHPDAQYHLGWLYANGNGMNVDVEKAVYWWQQAANSGFLDAQFAIGLAYITGEGIKTDTDMAFRWFFKAASGGHEDAKDIVKRLVLESGDDYYTRYPDLRQVSWLRQSVVVTGDVVNLRSGPGTSHDIVHKANKGDELQTIAKQGDWLEVVIDANSNQTAWIFSRLVKSQ